MLHSVAFTWVLGMLYAVRIGVGVPVLHAYCVLWSLADMTALFLVMLLRCSCMVSIYDYIEGTERSPRDGGDGGVRGLPLFAYCCIPLHFPPVHVNQPGL